MLFSEILRFPDVRLQVIKLLNLFPLCVARIAVHVVLGF